MRIYKVTTYRDNGPGMVVDKTYYYTKKETANKVAKDNWGVVVDVEVETY